MKDETKAFIEIIKEKYLSDDMPIEQLQTIESQEIERAKINNFSKNDEINSNTQIVTYKENKVVNFLRKIIEFFRVAHKINNGKNTYKLFWKILINF